MIAAARKEPGYLLLSDSTNVRIPRITQEKVVPQNEAVGSEHPQHFLRHLHPELLVQDGGENRKLANNIEALIRIAQISRISAFELNGRWTKLAGLRELFRQKVDTDHVFWPHPPLNKLPQPKSLPTTNFQHSCLGKRLQFLQAEYVHYASLEFLRDQEVPRVQVRIKVRRDTGSAGGIDVFDSLLLRCITSARGVFAQAAGSRLMFPGCPRAIFVITLANPQHVPVP